MGEGILENLRVFNGRESAPLPYTSFHTISSIVIITSIRTITTENKK